RRVPRSRGALRFSRRSRAARGTPANTLLRLLSDGDQLSPGSGRPPRARLERATGSSATRRHAQRADEASATRPDRGAPGAGKRLESPSSLVLRSWSVPGPWSVVRTWYLMAHRLEPQRFRIKGLGTKDHGRTEGSGRTKNEGPRPKDRYRPRNVSDA